MVGIRDSIIGDDVSAVLDRFLTSMPGRLPVAEGREAIFNSVLIEVDEATGRAASIERVDRECLLH
jgi:calcineurin-like phosphoesterase